MVNPSTLELDDIRNVLNVRVDGKNMEDKKSDIDVRALKNVIKED